MKALRVFYLTLLSGRGVRAERAKYHAIFYVGCFINIVHLLTFLVLEIPFLVIVNLLCQLSLVIMKHLIYRDKFFACMLISYMSFFLHEIIVTISLGWNFGFTYYIFGLIPLIFYLNFSNPISSRKTSVPITILLVSLSCFLGARFFSFSYGPIYSISSVTTVNTIFSMNCIICFLVVMLFCALYIMEMKAVQQRLREQNGQLRQLADQDPLTSLLNRRSMLEYLMKASEAYKAKEKNYCIILCDIDDFKLTNDTYGHECGDIVLIQTANLMRICLGEDCKISRWGGEEILMLVPWDLRLCIEKIEGLRRQLESFNFTYQQHRVRITMTFGIKSFDSRMSVQQVIQMADINLYEGKKIGKNCVVA